MEDDEELERLLEEFGFPPSPADQGDETAPRLDDLEELQ